MVVVSPRNRIVRSRGVSRVIGNGEGRYEFDHQQQRRVHYRANAIMGDLESLLACMKPKSGREDRVKELYTQLKTDIDLIQLLTDSETDCRREME